MVRAGDISLVEGLLQVGVVFLGFVTNGISVSALQTECVPLRIPIYELLARTSAATWTMCPCEHKKRFAATAGRGAKRRAGVNLQHFSPFVRVDQVNRIIGRKKLNCTIHLFASGSSEEFE